MKLNLLPILAVMAWAGCVLSPAPAVAAPPSDSSGTPSAAWQNIYSGSFQNGWQYWGWASTTMPVHSPALSSGSMEVTEGGWQAVYLHHAEFQTSTRMYFSFWINGGPTGGQSLVVKALRNGIPQTAFVLAPLKANTWQRVLITLPKMGVGSVPDMTGFWIENNSAATLPTFYLDQIALVTSGTPLLPAPSGLTATPQWAASCPTCGNMPMAHISLKWNAVSGASAYAIYRDGVKQLSQSAASWVDMGVTSGDKYTYAVASVGPWGQGPLSAPVQATAPMAPASAAAFTAPTNLGVQCSWQEGPQDSLTWTPVSGAASYNVYQYGVQIASAVKAAAFVVPQSLYNWSLSYTVTAVDASGTESLPSAIATDQGIPSPTQAPCWMPAAPAIPSSLSAVSEWNGGVPRIHLQWQGNGTTDFVYNVYRDGTQVAAALWGLNFYDAAVHPGEAHSYTVTGVNLPWTQTVESQQSAPITVTALTAPLAALSTPVEITGAVADDDSALISFAAVPGAVDYRVYDVTKPNSVKYSGGGLSIEMNGLNPAGADLVVEAVDKKGPFQTMDGMAGPGAMQMDGMHISINGQGDPSNIPLVLAVSAPYHVTLTPRTLTGDQAFFDNFRNEAPLTALPCPAPIPGDKGGVYGHSLNYLATGNDKWEIRDYTGDQLDTKTFFMGNHFMDTLYDGGTPGVNNPLHNNDSSLVMMPKATADISGGRILHVTFEVDAHFDSRRWCDVIVAPAADTLMNVGKLDGGLSPTTSGTMFRWEIQTGFHIPEMFLKSTQNNQSTQYNLVNVTNGVLADAPNVERMVWYTGAPLMNGTLQDLDKRHHFDLYLSQTHFRIVENGQLIKDADMPAGETLPFDQCQVYFVHQLYHTSNDRPELVTWDPSNSYWSNYRAWSDERHWDNMGEEVLSSLPPL